MHHTRRFNPTPRIATRQPQDQVVSEAFTGSKTPLPNPYCSPIPSLAFDTFGSVRNMPAVLTALKQDVESLIGVRGDQPNRAVTFKDLIDFGILSGEAVGSPNGLGGGQGPPGPPGTSIPLPVAIASGGTNAVTAPAALTNLGAVAKAGDTMTGGLTITPAPGVTNLSLVKINAADTADIRSYFGNARWAMLLGGNESETGSNSGTDFSLIRFNDIGVALGSPLTISRATGNATFSNNATFTGGLYSPFIRTGNPTGGNGIVGFSNGSTTTTGYIEWFLPNGTRQAYMGFNQSYLLLNLEQGGHLRVQGAGNAGIQFNNTAQTTSFALFDDGNSHIESTTTLWLNYNGNNVRTQGNFYIDNNKSLYMNGYKAMYADANYVVCYDTASSAALFLGGGSDRKNYYRNTGHSFGNIGGGIEYLAIDGTYTYMRIPIVMPAVLTGSNYYSQPIYFDANWGVTSIYIQGYHQPGVEAGFTVSAGGVQFWFLSNKFQIGVGTAYKPGGGVWADSSDIRTKEDIEDYPVSLDAITRLRPVRFKHNGRGGSERDGKTYVGLIADEVQDIMPEMVSSTRQKLDPDDIEDADILALDATPMLYAFVNAFKEVKQRLEILEAKQ